MFWDPTLIWLLPAILLTLYAQWKVSDTFSRYARVPLRLGLSGAETAERLAYRRNLPVSIVPVAGELTDHFDPVHNRLALSGPVYSGRSVAAAGVAAHELGHALQKAEGYSLLALRNGLVPLVGLGSSLSWPLFFAGFVFHLKPLLWAGVAAFTVAVGFALVTLPVEFDASRRALLALRQDGLVSLEEESGVRRVLSAAALTYVAAALMAVLQLLRLVSLANRNDD